MNRSLFCYYTFMILISLHLSCKENSEISNVELEEVLFDYFPLALNNKWIYDYSYYECIQPIFGNGEGTKVIKEGTVIWEVTNIKSNSDGYTYYIDEIYNLNIIEYDLDSNREVDSTKYIYIDSNQVQVFETNSSILYLSGKHWFYNFKMQRYLDSSNPPKIEPFFDEYVVKRDTGIVSMYYNFYERWYFQEFTEEYKLTSFERAD